MLDKSQLSHLSAIEAETAISKTANTSSTEIDKFDKLAGEWWDPKGKYKRVLDFNQCRWQVIEQQVKAHFNNDMKSRKLTAVDIGCGGGLLCEPLATMGIEVTGVDASEMSIKVASRHAKQSGLAIQYQHCLSTDLIADEKRYDIVMNTEVIEHVPDQQLLIDECCKLLKPGGLLILATLNRTLKSFIFGIVGAEYVLRLLPVGTHDWKAFVTPEEMNRMLRKNSCKPTFTNGIAFNPLSGKWSESGDTTVNYMMFAEHY